MKLKITLQLLFLICISTKIVAGCTSPVITSQPSNVVVCSGGNASYSVAATGPSLVYQWQEDQGSGFVNLSNIAPYSGVNTTTLTITGVTIGMNNYNYRCVVSNGCFPDATSNPATLKVNVAPSIVTQPSSASFCEGSTGTFSVTTSGTNLSYQWQVNTGSGFVNVPTGAPYSGDTTASLYITGTTAAMNGYSYQCIITGFCSSAITSATAVLTVSTLPFISAQPNFVITCEGDNTSISITAAGTGISYQWQVNQGSGYSNIPVGAPYSGVTSSSLLITNTAASMDGYLYQCVVTGACSPADTSYEIPLIVHPVYVNYKPVTICQGDSTLFGGSYYYSPGLYPHTFATVFGCDSLVYLSLNVSPAYYTTVSSVICQGDSILMGSTFQTAAGVYTYVLPTVSGCDSTIENTLSLNPSYRFMQSATICNGDSALVFGSYESVAGMYYDNYTTFKGCDSIYSFNLIVKPNYNITLNANVCNGDSILIGGVYESAAGSYINAYSSMFGCDSIVTTVLTVRPVYSMSQSVSICSNDSIFLAGAYQNTAGTYTDSLVSSFGCDSTVVTTLSVNASPVVTFDPLSVICDTTTSIVLSGGSPAGGTYSGTGVTSGIFYPSVAGAGSHPITYTFTSGAGCTESVTNNLVVSVCNGVTEYYSDLDVTMYPNPFNTVFTISSALSTPVELTIVNILGEAVYSQQINKGTITIDMSSFSAGIYFARISTSEKSMTRKIIKE